MKRKHELKNGGTAKIEEKFDETKSTYSKVSGSKLSRKKLNPAA